MLGLAFVGMKRVTGSGRPAASPVVVRTMNDLKDGWTQEGAVDLLKQGYGIDAVATRTGCDKRWLRAQQARLQAQSARKRQRDDGHDELAAALERLRG